MVLIAQSDTNEDSQGRQLRVNKKLSKAISSVPRSRFQKPRPNIPGSKRPDSASLPASTHKSVETPQSKDDKSPSIFTTEKTVQNEDKIQIVTAVLNTKDTPEKIESSNTELCTDVIVVNGAVSDSGTVVKGTGSDSPTFKIEETVEKRNDNSVSSTDETVKKAGETYGSNTGETEKECSNNSIILPKDEKSEDGYSSNTPMLNTTMEVLQKDDKNTAISVIREIVQEEDIAITSILSANKTCQVEDIPIVVTQGTSAAGNLLEQNKNDTANISSNTTDRSSKYPHLTSILSKKRTEPKKEVQHKRRKKFKKGDGPPDRTKMTMADLIYWNPSKTDEPAKISESINIEPEPINNEEECVDGDVAEDNVYDSVPKLVISEDGQINIDQTSLIISRNVPQVTHTEVIRKDEATYSSYRKRPLTKHWSVKDTTIFYKALSLVGTDFGLMEKIFPHRTRRELKQKFKREEKFNIDLVNRAMYESQLTFDANTLEDLIEHLNNLSDDNLENAENSETPAKAKKKSSNKKQKTTKKTQSVHELSDSATESVTNEDVLKIVKRNKRQRKTKNLPEGFVGIDDIESSLDSDPELTDSCENVLDSVPEGIISCENIQDLAPEETISYENALDSVSQEAISCELNLKKCRKKNQKKVSFIPQGDLCVEENVDADINNTSANDDQVECIPIQYIENISSVSETTLLSDVMAYEVVCCEPPVAKKARKLNIIPKNNQTFLSVLLSSANYTPV